VGVGVGVGVCVGVIVSSVCSVVGSALDMEDVAEKLPTTFKVRLKVRT